MSDFYDSLEDEGNSKSSSESEGIFPKNNEISYISRSDRSKYLSKIGSFQLNGNVKEKNLFPNPPCAEPVGFSPKYTLLPKIEGADVDSKLVITDKILKQQGLQRNLDGSFTKSPRQNTETLPFITREYRNLQFQKIKTYKRGTPRTLPRLNFYEGTEEGENKTNTSKLSGSKRNKESSEEIEKSKRSNRETQNKQNNLTDTMKQKLLENRIEKPIIRTNEAKGKVKKTKCLLNLLESHKNLQQVKPNQPKQEPLKVQCNEKKKNLSEEKVTQNKKEQTTVKQMSEITLNSKKSNLSYSERRMLQKGYNPLCLRQDRKKVVSDTDRANFGDLVIEDLSDVSSRILSIEDLPGMTEESYYRKLIAKDVKLKCPQRSSRSEGPLGFEKLKAAVDSSRNQRSTKDTTTRPRPICKSFSIDLPSEKDASSRQSKKVSHYCSSENAHNLSKYDLAQKAKAYGYLVNARNLFKMRAQKNRAKHAEKEERCLKVLEKSFFDTHTSDHDSQHNTSTRPTRKKSSPKINTEVKLGLKKASNAVPKPKKSPTKTKSYETSKKCEKTFILPQVSNPDSKIRADILRQMSFCLGNSNGYIDKIPY